MLTGRIMDGLIFMAWGTASLTLLKNEDKPLFLG